MNSKISSVSDSSSDDDFNNKSIQGMGEETDDQVDVDQIVCNRN